MVFFFFLNYFFGDKKRVFNFCMPCAYNMPFDFCRYKFSLFNELYFLVAGGTVWIGTHLQSLHIPLVEH